MTLGQAVFGIIGMAMFVPIMFYSIRVLEHFLQSDDLSMREVFVESKGLNAFKVLFGTFLVYAVTLIVSGLGEQFNITVTTQIVLGEPVTIGIIAQLDRIGGLLAYIGIAYFVYRVANLTRL